MKKIIVLLIVISCSALNAQVPTAFSVHARGSDVNALVGAEFQLSKFSISEGWRPVDVYNVDAYSDSYITTLTMYGKPWYESSHYISIGFASKGFSEQLKSGDTKWKPSMIIMFGYKSVIDQNNRLSGKIGFGFNKCRYEETFVESKFVFEISVSLVIIQEARIRKIKIPRQHKYPVTNPANFF